MVVHTKIEFDNNSQGVYYSGQTISGTITLTVDKPKQVKGITLKINGSSYVKWLETKSSCCFKQVETYEGKEDYIESITSLLVPDDTHSLVIETGVHMFAFSCQLPATCPSSFEARNGFIRYTIKVILVRPWKFDQSYTKCFTVLKKMNVNHDSPLKKVPLNIETQETYSCWPCSTGPLEISASVLQSVYVPGQTIPVSVIIKNKSFISVKTISAKLIMVIEYISQEPKRKSRKELIKVTELVIGGVIRGSRQCFTLSLLVPATPSTSCKLSRQIQVSYLVQVEAKTRRNHPDQILTIPVTIGNVPLIAKAQQNYFRQELHSLNVPATQNPVEYFQTSEHKNIISLELRAVTIENNEGTFRMTEMRRSSLLCSKETIEKSPFEVDFPPSSYEKAPHIPQVSLNEQGKHDYGQTDFSPYYPVFNMPRSSSLFTLDEESIVEGAFVNQAMEYDSTDKISSL